MRSNDIWFGAGNDIPIFRWTQHMMAVCLGVPVGLYLHNVDSLHIYERHFAAADGCLLEDSVAVQWPAMKNPLAMISREMSNPLGKPVDDFHAWLLENARV
jgi:thymidylate synthase